MRHRPKNTLNHSQYDFLILLAEDLPWRSAAESVGWQPVTVRSQLYLMMDLLHMRSAIDLDQNLAALVREAKLRGYASQIYSWDAAEDDQPLPRFVPVLPQREEAI